MDDMFVKRVINCVIWHRRVTHGGARCSLLLFWSFYFGKYVDGRCRWQWRKLELAFVWRRRKRRLLGAAGENKKWKISTWRTLIYWGTCRLCFTATFPSTGPIGFRKMPVSNRFRVYHWNFLLKLWNLIQIKRAALSDIFRWIFQKMIFVEFNFEINENIGF